MTKDGCKVMTKFPAEDLLVAGCQYCAVAIRSHVARREVAPETPRRAAAWPRLRPTLLTTI